MKALHWYSNSFSNVSANKNLKLCPNTHCIIILGKSLRAIASELNLDGVRTKGGKKFTQQTIKNILVRCEVSIQLSKWTPKTKRIIENLPLPPLLMNQYKNLLL